MPKLYETKFKDGSILWLNLDKVVAIYCDENHQTIIDCQGTNEDRTYILSENIVDTLVRINRGFHNLNEWERTINEQNNI